MIIFFRELGRKGHHMDPSTSSIHGARCYSLGGSLHVLNLLYGPLYVHGTHMAVITHTLYGTCAHYYHIIMIGYVFKAHFVYTYRLWDSLLQDPWCAPSALLRSYRWPVPGSAEFLNTSMTNDPLGTRCFDERHGLLLNPSRTLKSSLFPGAVISRSLISATSMS